MEKNELDRIQKEKEAKYAQAVQAANKAEHDARQRGEPNAVAEKNWALEFARVYYG